MATFIYPQIDISDLAIAHIETNTANTVTELQAANASLDNIETATGNTVTELQTANSTLSTLATSANQTNGTQKSQIVDASANVVTSTDAGGGKRALDINIASGSITASNPSVGVTGGITPSSATLIGGNNSSMLMPLAVNGSGELALPQGASTSAAQTDGTQKTQIVDGSGNVIASTSNALNVAITSGGGVATGTVDANNSTTTPLGISGVFTGTATDIKDYGTVSVLVASDVAAASGGFSLQFSNNGTNWDHAHNFDFAGGNLSYNISAEARYFRIVYTNNTVAQSYFRLQTVLRPVYVMPSQYTVAQAIADSNLSTVTKGVIYGKTTGMGGGYVAVKVNPSGALTTENTVTSSVLPTGAATETTLQSVSSSASTLAGTVIGGRVNVDVMSSALPLGAATELTLQGRASESTLSTLNGKIPSNLTVSSTRLLVDGSGVTQPVSGTVTANAGTGTFAISAVSLPLPTGAATASNQTAQQGSASGGTAAAVSSLSGAIYNSSAPTLTNGQQASLQLDSAGNLKTTSATVGTGLANAPLYKDYSAGSIGTGAYTQLVASTTSAANTIEIFDSSGQLLYLATGAAGAEVNQMIIFPGGNGRVTLQIPAGTRVSAKAITASATSGYLAINFYK